MLDKIDPYCWINAFNCTNKFYQVRIKINFKI